jgi:uncharacterized protein (DUF2235 family)
MPAIFGSPVLIEQPLFSPRLRHPVEFLDTHLRLDSEYAYHALALDEHREDFEATFSTRTVKKGEAGAPERTIGKVEQRWFVGAHANVGGGYASDPLSQRPLVWLMDKAAGLGLAFRDQVVIDTAQVARRSSGRSPSGSSQSPSSAQCSPTEKPWRVTSLSGPTVTSVLFDSI